MNLNAMKRNCKARGRITIMNVLHGGQWISDGVAAWPVEHVRIDEEAVVSLFNLSEKQRDKLYIRETIQSDERFRAYPLDGEEELMPLGLMEWSGGLWCALKSRDGVLYIEDAPIEHLKRDYIRFAARWAFGRPLVAVYDGLGMAAIILPAENGWARKIQGKAASMAMPAYVWPDAEDEAAEAEEEAERLAGEMGV